jgi:hypothetical protein
MNLWGLGREPFTACTLEVDYRKRDANESLGVCRA